MTCASGYLLDGDHCVPAPPPPPPSCWGWHIGGCIVHGVAATGAWTWDHRVALGVVGTCVIAVEFCTTAIWVGAGINENSVIENAGGYSHLSTFTSTRFLVGTVVNAGGAYLGHSCTRCGSTSPPFMRKP